MATARCGHPWHKNPALITPCPECGAGNDVVTFGLPTTGTHGLWKSGRAGGWCLLRTGLPRGTRAEAEAAKLVYDGERPEFTYTVELFDPDREPEANVGYVTHAMLDCLEAVNRGEDIYLPRVLGGKFSRGTIRALFDQGLIMHDPMRLRGEKVTSAGRAVLKGAGVL